MRLIDPHYNSLCRKDIYVKSLRRLASGTWFAGYRLAAPRTITLESGFSMHTTRSIRRTFICPAALSLALALGLLAMSAEAQQGGNDGQDEIVVYLLSGRTMTAKIDARTDTLQLWLRWDSPGAEVLRPIRWQFVAVAEISGQKISGTEFRGLVEQIRRDVPAQPESAPTTTSIVMLGTPEANAPKSSAAPGNVQESKALPVQWLDIEAGPARWDQYCDIDGMSILVAPKDAYGQVIPVRGTLDVDLIAEYGGVVRLPDPFSRIGHWSQAVHPDDFGPFGAVYKLPFQDVNPEFSDHLGPHGAVHATLSVPGQDTFQATADARIRPYSLIRDRLMQTTGRRFFPEETIGQPWEKH